MILIGLNVVAKNTSARQKREISVKKKKIIVKENENLSVKRVGETTTCNRETCRRGRNDHVK